jgi:hypothetical protein
VMCGPKGKRTRMSVNRVGESGGEEDDCRPAQRAKRREGERLTERSLRSG